MKRIGMFKDGTFGHPKISSEHPLHLHVKYLIANINHYPDGLKHINKIKIYIEKHAKIII